MADRIMTLVLQLIQGAGKTSTVLEDAFLVVGSLAAGTHLLRFRPLRD
jgi:importin subunit beta-1